ncbi:hypothetical protein MMC17_007738 [Xylographa soralifera]|nr:hypothetical protein [Xylographa soralifera]
MSLPTLTGLPLELKQQILKYVLIADTPIYMKPPILSYPMRATFLGQKSGLHPGIISATKTWTVEGLTILYRDNIFFFKTVRTFRAFVESISRFSHHMPFNNLHRVKHICLGVGSEFLDFIANGHLKGNFPNLMTVDLNRWYYDEGESPTRDACREYQVGRMLEELDKTMDIEVRVVRFEM